MLKNSFLFVCTFVCVLYVSTASLIPFIKPCKVNDNDCLVATNIQIALPYLADGIPELGITASEPMEFENITMEQGYFKFVLPHLKVFGSKKCRLVDFKLNQQESIMKMTIDCPVKATGDYKFSGKICIFNIDKEGVFKLKTDAMRTTITTKTDVTVGKDGKRYWNILDYNYVYEPLGAVHIELDDLFVGDVSKAQSYLNVLNKEFGNDVLKMGEPIAADIVKYFWNVLKIFFLQVPIDQITYS